jgi:hypothetical protein
MVGTAESYRMSKRSNVNPDYYKLAGRERSANVASKAPRLLAEEEAARARWMERQNRKPKVKGEK